MKLSPMIRTALFVADLDRSTEFYRNVLGLAQVFWEGELEGSSLERLLGRPEGTFCRARILQSGDATVGMVGLFELSRPAPATVGKHDDGANIGETCLVYYCSDLDEIMRRLAAGNHRVVCEPIPLEVDGRSKQREMTCADPDGVLINLIEWDPDEPRKPEHS